MILFKVLIILTFTINISHCEFSEKQIQIECKVCAGCLRVIGFKYKLPFINYNIGMHFGKPEKENNFDPYLLNTLFSGHAISDLERKNGESKLTYTNIKSYVTEYYKEIIDYKPKITPMSPQDFCQEQFNQMNAYTKCAYNKFDLTIDTINECEINLQSRFNYNGYINVASSYEIYIKRAQLKIEEDEEEKSDLQKFLKDVKNLNPLKRDIKVFDSLSVKEDIKTLAPNLRDEKKYYGYLLKYIEDNLTKMEMFDTQTWCNEHIPKFLNDLQKTVQH